MLAAMSRARRGVLTKPGPPQVMQNNKGVALQSRAVQYQKRYEPTYVTWQIGAYPRKQWCDCFMGTTMWLHATSWSACPAAVAGCDWAAGGGVRALTYSSSSDQCCYMTPATNCSVLLRCP
eukprot:GHUV01021303.1.p1 GENE.GHUV01021303.1~~GHUV01021303.1.p1  ORF type:complete len:121 (-),score=24.09 GHUV01021303.1:151-513(-)